MKMHEISWFAKPLALAIAGTVLGLAAGCATTKVDELALRRQVEELILDYTYHHDRRDAAAITDMFTEDATIQVGEGPLTSGRAAVMQRFANRPPDRLTRHLTTNLRIVLDDPSHASATRIMVYYAADPGTDRMITAPRGVTEYAETFVRGTDGRWRFRSRHITPLFGPP